MVRFLVFLLLSASILLGAVLLSKNIGSTHPSGDQVEMNFSDDEMVTYDENTVDSIEEDTYDGSHNALINKMLHIDGLALNFGDRYEEVRHIFGEPENEFSEGGYVLIEYGDISIGFTATDIGDNEYPALLSDIERRDLFTSKEEVISILGEPQTIEYAPDLGVDVHHYLIEHLDLFVWVDDREEVRNVILIQF